MSRLPAVFLSRTTPHLPAQAALVQEVRGTLEACGLSVRSLESDSQRPLETIVEEMESCAGTVAIVLARSRIDAGDERPGGAAEQPIGPRWQATAWSHVEIALAHRLDHPILLLIEERVHREGLLDPALTGAAVSTFAFDRDGWSFTKELRVVVARFADAVRSQSAGGPRHG